MKELSYKLVKNESELKGAFEVRRRVFVEEQGVAEELDLDGNDGKALHMVVKDGAEVVGTARVRFLNAKQAKLERMAVLDGFRRKGIGSGITAFLIEELSNRQVDQVVLHAQYRGIAFYRSCGFEETGLTFTEAGLKHIKMQRRL
jgi:predicted GNAT family N-acyltransferase